MFATSAFRIQVTRALEPPEEVHADPHENPPPIRSYVVVPTVTVNVLIESPLDTPESEAAAMVAAVFVPPVLNVIVIGRPLGAVPVAAAVIVTTLLETLAV
jgi:hypothetical protein